MKKLVLLIAILLFVCGCSTVDERTVIEVTPATTAIPTAEPTPEPTEEPTPEPTAEPKQLSLSDEDWEAVFTMHESSFKTYEGIRNFETLFTDSKTTIIFAVMLENTITPEAIKATDFTPILEACTKNLNLFAAVFDDSIEETIYHGVFDTYGAIIGIADSNGDIHKKYFLYAGTEEFVEIS